MIFKIVCVLWAVVCVLAAPSPTDVVPLEKHQPTVIPIVSQSEELEPNGTYKFSYETGNGIKREEISYDKVLPKVEGRSASSKEGGESNESDEIHVQQGSYSYTAPDGTVISLRYIADENGFQPEGDHLPKAPSVLQNGAGSNEKTGRALKVPDNAEAGSAPISVAKSVQRPESTEAAPTSLEAKSAEIANEATSTVKSAESPSEATSTATPAIPENEASPKSQEVPTESSTSSTSAKASPSEASAGNPTASVTESASTTSAIA